MLGFVGTRQWVYPQSITGRYQRIRRWTFALLHLILFVTPWITVNGNPALRFDLPGRRLFAFGAIFTPRDTVLLLLLLLALAFSLFFFTALFGRVWCGYACPQTVFLDTWIRPLERRLEGDRNARMRRDAAGWTLDRAWRKALKWTLFLAVAFWVSMAFTSYFVDARALWSGRASGGAYSLVAAFTGLFFLDFTWFREQFCNYLCPYARFQSVLADEHSLIISYDEPRGEPRGGAAAKTEGRCVDCNKCVVVCPQGIDIRNGFQLECIACARCVDACTSVMDRLGHETLVRYSTLARDRGRTVRRVRPRTIVYSGLLTAIAASIVLLVSGRTPIEANVSRAPGSLYTVDTDGHIRNTYLLRIGNNAPGEGEVPFHVHVEGLPGAEVICEDVKLRSTESRLVPLVIRVPAAGTLARTIPIRVRVSTPAHAVEVDATFKTGGQLAASPSAD